MKLTLSPFLLAISIGGCASNSTSSAPQPTDLPTKPQAPSVATEQPNPVAQQTLDAYLKGAVRVDVTRGPIGTAPFELAKKSFSIDDPAQLSALRYAMGRTSMGSTAIPRCPPSLRLRFYGSNGDELANLGAICGGLGSGSNLVRSDKLAWNIQDMDGFKRVLQKASQ